MKQQTRSQKRAAANQAAAQTKPTDATPEIRETTDGRASDEQNAFAVIARLRLELDEANALLDSCRPRCECGCQTRTKGGRFVPGHDAKLHSVRLAAERLLKPVPVKATKRDLANIDAFAAAC